MLATFSRPACADITMFGDVAVHLLKTIGHSGTVPSALVAADLPAPLERLEAAVAAAGESSAPGEASQAEDEEPEVSLRRRALPLIELLKAAGRRWPSAT